MCFLRWIGTATSKMDVRGWCKMFSSAFRDSFRAMRELSNRSMNKDDDNTIVHHLPSVLRANSFQPRHMPMAETVHIIRSTYCDVRRYLHPRGRDGDECFDLTLWHKPSPSLLLAAAANQCAPWLRDLATPRPVVTGNAFALAHLYSVPLKDIDDVRADLNQSTVVSAPPQNNLHLLDWLRLTYAILGHFDIDVLCVLLCRITQLDIIAILKWQKFTGTATRKAVLAAIKPLRRKQRQGVTLLYQQFKRLTVATAMVIARCANKPLGLLLLPPSSRHLGVFGTVDTNNGVPAQGHLRDDVFFPSSASSPSVSGSVSGSVSSSIVGVTVVAQLVVLHTTATYERINITSGGGNRSWEPKLATLRTLIPCVIGESGSVHPWHLLSDAALEMSTLTPAVDTLEPWSLIMLDLCKSGRHLLQTDASVGLASDDSRASGPRAAARAILSPVLLAQHNVAKGGGGAEEKGSGVTDMPFKQNGLMIHSAPHLLEHEDVVAPIMMEAATSSSSSSFSSLLDKKEQQSAEGVSMESIGLQVSLLPEAKLTFGSLPLSSVRNVDQCNCVVENHSSRDEMLLISQTQLTGNTVVAATTPDIDIIASRQQSPLASLHMVCDVPKNQGAAIATLSSSPLDALSPPSPSPSPSPLPLSVPLSRQEELFCDQMPLRPHDAPAVMVASPDAFVLASSSSAIVVPETESSLNCVSAQEPTSTQPSSSPCSDPKVKKKKKINASLHAESLNNVHG